MIRREEPKHYYLELDKQTWKVELNIVKILDTDEILMRLSADALNPETGLPLEDQPVAAPVRECKIRDEKYLINIILEAYRDELLKISGCSSNGQRRYYSLKPA